MTLLTYLQFLLHPPIRILVGSDPTYKLPKTQLIPDVYYSPQVEGYPKDYFWIHTLMEGVGRILPVGTFNGHPDWFALINGNRSLNQVCFSSQGLLDFVISHIPATNKIISISYNDNFEWCGCDKCKGKVPSSLLIGFINNVARRYPSKQFSTLCYQQTQTPSIKPLPNVQVMLTTITVPKDKPIEFGDRGEAIEFRSDLAGWLALTKNILIWDYTCNFRHLLMPFPITRNIGRNIHWYNRMGVRQYLIQNNSGPGHEFSEMKSHIIEQMMYCPNQDPDKVMEAFGSSYFGKAWVYIKEYIELLEVEQRKGKWCLNWGSAEEFRDSFLSDANLSKHFMILLMALNQVKDNPIIALRVKTVRLQLDYVCIELGIRDRVEAFRSVCTELGSVTVNENNLTFKQYLINHEIYERP